jgi:Flp pilus assembly pilin Flp
VINVVIAWLRLHVRSERGQDLIEYALLGGLIGGALLVVGVFVGLENGITSMANGIGECIDFDSGTDCTP